MKDKVMSFWSRRVARLTSAVLLVGALSIGYIAQQASAQQPHMQAALEALRTAENQLGKATQDKGGHRKKALDHVRKAIKEVEKGIAYDRRN